MFFSCFPCRYSREEAFTVISIDIRNYSNLYDSLEQYVKGDLLEGDNAYLCEKCDKKVSALQFYVALLTHAWFEL